MAAIDRFLSIMVEEGASDLHMTSGEPLTLRIDGMIVQSPETSGGVFASDVVQAALVEIMPDANREEFLGCSDTDFAYEIEGVGRFRVNAFVDHSGAGGVFKTSFTRKGVDLT